MSSALDIVDHSPHHPEATPPLASASNVILIDNYDSFTWNVYQYLVLEGATARVIRNDEVSIDELIALNPTQLVISPGPGHPATDSGVSRDAIKHFSGKIPIFGVCMGQQCIFEVYGGTVDSAGEILHGKTSPLAHDGKGVYAGLSQDLPVTRYHSLAGTASSLPPTLEVTSWINKPDGSRGVIMGVRHKEYTIEGVQFHPESILSADGRTMIRNFLLMRGGTWAENEKLQAADKAADKAAVKAADAAAAPSKGNNILQRIYARRQELVAAQRVIPSQRLEDLQAAYDAGAAPPALPLIGRLRKSPFPVALMAEIKRASPSKGVFAIDIRAPEQALEYAKAGASVISVLTEPDWFKGSIEDLRAVRQVLQWMPNRPAILRKEFIFDEYQILEARLAGADTVLLIIKMLDDDALARLYKYSQSLGMEPLVEVQNAAEMTRAVALGAKAIGVNNRNLESFEVDIKTTSRLRSMVPEDTILCALSGINTRADVVENEKDGVNAVLVGESIMRAADPAQFIRHLCSGAPLSAPSSSTSFRAQPLLVKICGTRSAEAALEAARSGADLVGMILVPGTKRCVSDETALAISKALHEYVDEEAGTASTAVASPAIATDFFSIAQDTFSRKRNGRPLLVGVFMNQPLEEVLAKTKLYNLDVVQLHGREPVEWARQIPVPVVHKFGPGEAGVSQRGYHAASLLDSGAGSGAKLEVSAVQAELERDAHLTFLFAGGLTPDNLASVLTALGSSASARILGVDTSSGVETDGKQDLAKIRAFVQTAKQFGQ